LPIGAVISQTPGAGEADKGSTITLLVSKGSEFVVIPNIKLMKAGEAINVIEDLGLKVKKPNIRNWEKKLVKTISPAVGTKVKRGSTITITVG